MAQYKAALARMDARGARTYLEGDQSLTIARNGKTLRERRRSVVIARDGAKVLLRTRHGGLAEEEVELSLPPAYYVIRSRRIGGPYYLPKSQEQIGDGESRTVSAYNDNMLGAPYSLLYHRISQLLKEPGLAITSVQPERSGSKGMWKMSFRMKADSPSLGQGSGWFIVDPDMGWALLSFEFRSAEDTTTVSSGRVSYGRQVDGLPVPKEVETTDKTLVGSDTYITKARLDIKKFEWGPYPEEEFTLDYYKLGDLARSTPGGGGARGIVLLLLAALLLGLSIYVKRYLKPQPAP